MRAGAARRPRDDDDHDDDDDDATGYYCSNSHAHAQTHAGNRKPYHIKNRRCLSTYIGTVVPVQDDWATGRNRNLFRRGSVFSCPSAPPLPFLFLSLPPLIPSRNGPSILAKGFGERF